MIEFRPQQLVLVRHGQSTLNASRAHSPVFFQTEADRDAFEKVPDHRVPLTEKGIAQARALGKGLRGRGFYFDIACDSGYERTICTLNLLLEAYPEEVREQIQREHSLLIREREGGYTYSMTQSEVTEQFPWLNRYWQAYAPVLSRPVGGESIAELIQRIMLFMMWNASHWRGRRVLISSHGRTITAFRYVLENWTNERLVGFLNRTDEPITGERTPKNCSMTKYTWSETKRRLVLDEYNTCFETE